jgi:UDP-3-O-[3-hydroxymyristoyl] glucosamine N-acyltransferase
MKSYRPRISRVLKGVISGSTSQTITAPEQLGVATDSEISFIGNKSMRNYGQHLKLALQL